MDCLVLAFRLERSGREVLQFDGPLRWKSSQPNTDLGEPDCEHLLRIETLQPGHFRWALMYFSIAARPSDKLLFHMLAYQIFQTIPADLAETIFTYFRKQERDTYKGAIERLAEQQKMRSVFITKQSPDKQVKLLTAACGRKQAESIAMHLLEQWLMGDRQAILIDFMDRMKISHDGAGMAEKLPDTMDEAMVRSAVEAMLKTHPSQEVALYLNVFQEQKEGGWPELSALLDADPWLTA